MLLLLDINALFSCRKLFGFVVLFYSPLVSLYSSNICRAIKSTMEWKNTCNVSVRKQKEGKKL
jgi:hypothetical protein